MGPSAGRRVWQTQGTTPARGSASELRFVGNVGVVFLPSEKINEIKSGKALAGPGVAWKFSRKGFAWAPLYR